MPNQLHTTAQKRNGLEERTTMVTQASRLQLLMLGRNLLALHSPCASGGPEQRISNGTILNNWSPASRTAASVRINLTRLTTISATESETRVFVWNPVGQDPLLLFLLLLPSATTPQRKEWHCSTGAMAVHAMVTAHLL